MTWAAIVQLIADEVGAAAAARIDRRVVERFSGARITVSKRRRITAELIDRVAPGRPREAARRLGVHPATVYRALRIRGRKVAP